MNIKNLQEKLRLIIVLILAVAIIGTYLGLSSDTINWIVEWLVSLFIGLLLSAVAGSLVEAFTGNFLKTIFLNISIYGDLSISISAFTIATLVVKILLFGL